MEEMRNACKIIFEKPDGKRELGRSTYRKKGNLKTYFKEV
jgi:hypothetical protein